MGELGHLRAGRRHRRRTTWQPVLGSTKISERVTRTTFLCVVANVLVWISFLVFNPPLTESEFSEITARRAGQDSQNGLDLIDHEPLVVDGRWSGTYGAVNNADRALSLFSGPAVMFTNVLVVPPRYIPPARAAVGRISHERVRSDAAPVADQTGSGHAMTPLDARSEDSRASPRLRPC